MGDSVSRRSRDPEEIRAEIDRARAEIASSLMVLRTEVRQQLEWRTLVRERPQVALAAAFAIGYWLGRR
jgi:hypothetical protein